MRTSEKLRLIALISTSCAHLNTLSLTEIPIDRSRYVEAKTSKWVILGLNFNNDFINELSTELQMQCKGGTGLIMSTTLLERIFRRVTALPGHRELLINKNFSGIR